MKGTSDRFGIVLTHRTGDPARTTDDNAAAVGHLQVRNDRQHTKEQRMSDTPTTIAVATHRPVIVAVNPKAVDVDAFPADTVDNTVASDVRPMERAR